MTADSNDDRVARNLRRIRASAAFLLACGIAVVFFSMLLQAERAAVQITSYSKLREMQSTERIKVPTGEELSFTRPNGDLWALHGDLFPNHAQVHFHALTLLGAATALISGLILFLARASNFSASSIGRTELVTAALPRNAGAACAGPGTTDSNDTSVA